jgi:hypothetical protein
MNLASESRNYGCPEASPSKKTYPSFSLSDDLAVEFSKNNPCSVGTEFTATVKIRVQSLRSDEYGKSVGIAVLDMDNIKRKGAKESMAEDLKKFVT